MPCPAGTYSDAGTNGCKPCIIKESCPIASNKDPLKDCPINRGLTLNEAIACIGTPILGDWKLVTYGHGIKGTLGPGVYRIDGFQSYGNQNTQVMIFDHNIGFYNSVDDVVYIDINNANYKASSFHLADSGFGTTLFTPGVGQYGFQNRVGVTIYSLY
jgi:hypothetical protein